MHDPLHLLIKHVLFLSWKKTVFILLVCSYVWVAKQTGISMLDKHARTHTHTHTHTHKAAYSHFSRGGNSQVNTEAIRLHIKDCPIIQSSSITDRLMYKQNANQTNKLLTWSVSFSVQTSFWRPFRSTHSNIQVLLQHLSFTNMEVFLCLFY